MNSRGVILIGLAFAVAGSYGAYAIGFRNGLEKAPAFYEYQKAQDAAADAYWRDMLHQAGPLDPYCERIMDTAREALSLPDDRVEE